MYHISMVLPTTIFADQSQLSQRQSRTPSLQLRSLQLQHLLPMASPPASLHLHTSPLHLVDRVPRVVQEPVAQVDMVTPALRPPTSYLLTAHHLQAATV